MTGKRYHSIPDRGDLEIATVTAQILSHLGKPGLNCGCGGTVVLRAETVGRKEFASHRVGDECLDEDFTAPLSGQFDQAANTLPVKCIDPVEQFAGSWVAVQFLSQGSDAFEDLAIVELFSERAEAPL